MNFNDLIEQELAGGVDQSVATKGGEYTYVPPVNGKHPARFIEYVELGSHVEQYQGKDKPSAPQVRVTFELLGNSAAIPDIEEIEVEGVGKKKIAKRITIDMALSTAEKSKFFKLFKAMQRGRDNIKHMAQMLGEAFFVIVKQADNGKQGAEKRVYANIWFDSAWHVESPVIEDPMAGTRTDYSEHIHAAISPIKLFLFNNPTKECWDSLFIDGTYEVKKGDQVTQVSKNKIQETIMSATNFEGSKLQVEILAGLKLPTTDKPAEQEVKQETKQADPANNPSDAGNPDDALAALGLK